MKLALPLLLAAVAAAGDDDLAQGGQTYRLLCQGCHGDDGDATSYPNVVPVAGIARRYPPETIARLSGSFSGRALYGRDREHVVRYMMTLPGAKAHPDPGWLTVPHLLEQKSQRIHEFRVIDARSRQAYAGGHVPNAVHAESQACIEDPHRTADWMASAGITAATVVVVYDETGGPAAACQWLRLRRAGHHWVSVLDGGWRRWIEEHRFVDTSIPRIEAVAPRSSAPLAAATTFNANREAHWHWRDALAAGGFRDGPELRRRLAASGILDGESRRWTGPANELAHLALTSALLGFEIEIGEGLVFRAKKNRGRLEE